MNKMTRFFLKFIKVRERHTSQMSSIWLPVQFHSHSHGQPRIMFVQDSSSLTNVQRVP